MKQTISSEQPHLAAIANQWILVQNASKKLENEIYEMEHSYRDHSPAEALMGLEIMGTLAVQIGMACAEAANLMRAVHDNWEYVEGAQPPSPEPEPSPEMHAKLAEYHYQRYKEEIAKSQESTDEGPDELPYGANV